MPLAPVNERRPLIVVAFSDIERAAQKIELLVSLAQRLDARVLALHVHPDPGENRCQAAEEFQATLSRSGAASELDIELRTLFTSGVVATICRVAAAEEADLIVAGASEGAIPSRGALSDRLVDRAPCPVLIVPPDRRGAFRRGA